MGAIETDSRPLSRFLQGRHLARPGSFDVDDDIINVREEKQPVWTLSPYRTRGSWSTGREQRGSEVESGRDIDPPSSSCEYLLDRRLGRMEG